MGLYEMVGVYGEQEVWGFDEVVELYCDVTVDNTSKVTTIAVFGWKPTILDDLLG